MSLKSDESSVTVAEASFLLTPDGASTTSNSIGTGARSPTPSTTILTARGIVRGVVTALCFVLVVATGFGVAGYIQDKAVGQRPINVVDSGKCTCDCFDGVMKGIYFQRKTNENPHVTEYKSLYINYDKNMWHLVIWMSLHIAMLAKVVGKISNCLFAGRLRWAGIPALIPLIYLCQYNFTSFANYINDRIYSPGLFRVQFFFFLSGYPYFLAVYHSLDKTARMPAALPVIAEAILLAHILIALWEQGFEHLLQWNAHLTIIIRDLMLLLCDASLLVYLIKCVGRPWKSAVAAGSVVGGDEDVPADTLANTPAQWPLFGATMFVLFVVWEMCLYLP